MKKTEDTLAVAKGNNSSAIIVRNHTTQKIIAGKYMENKRIGCQTNQENYDSKGIQVAKTATSSSGEATACDAQGNSTTSLNLNKEQMEQLYELLTPTKPDISLLAQKGTFLTALSGIAEK